MGIQSWSEDVILVDLPRALEGQGNELQTLVEAVRHKGGRNVVVDFCDVDIVGSTTFARLLELKRVLQDSGHKLVLCGLSPATKGVFTISRLDTVFEFVRDRSAALASLQMMP